MMADTSFPDRSLGVLSGDRPFYRLAHGLVWLTFAFSGFVMFEPAPYDALMIGSIVLFAIVGLPLPSRTAPLILLLMIVVAGGFLSSVVMATYADTSRHIAITSYLSLSSIFVAAYIAQNPTNNVKRIMVAYCFAAALASIGAILGYFGLAGPVSDSLLIYGRAKSTFEDPNVLGPFLVAPTLYVIHYILHGDKRSAILTIPLFGIYCLAVLLSFSRGAWGHLAFSAAIFGYFSFITATHIRDRFRLVLIAILGLSLLISAVVAALSVEKVRNLFLERASLTQSYDTGPMGRFGRQVRALDLIANSPLGIGAKEFEKIFPEAPHNVYINTFILSGWAGGIAYILLIGCSLVAGFRQSLRRTSGQGVYIAIYATFLGVALEGFLIDSDHWRHFYLILGLIWGGALAPGGVLHSSGRQPQSEHC